jgi:uncharacterized protein Veg
MKKILIACICLFSVAMASAQVDLKPSSVNVFKNGTYFITKEGSVKVRDGMAKIELPAHPLLGTFWFSSAKDLKITKVVFITDTIKKTKNPQSIADIIMANVGRQVKLTSVLADKNIREISGKLTDYYPATGIARLQLGDKRISFVPTSSVIDVTIEDMIIGNLKVDSLARNAQLYFEKSSANADIKLIYMQPGIQWLPAYNIKILSPEELQLEMKATVENYSEDIDEADLTLTVGSPQFAFNKDEDPVASNYLSALFSSPAANPSSYVMQAQSYYENAIVANDRSPVQTPVYSDYGDYATEGEKTNDLYMYKLGKASLPKNSKTTFQIFSVRIPYKDMYEVSINDVVSYASYSYISNDPEQRFDVYHSLQLTNTTVYPFTTAPVFVLNENLQPLAQDRIKYTPTGSNISVQLSKAGDVIIKNKEEEVKKEENVRKLGKISYNKVTMKGTVNIENMQEKKILLNIKKDILASVTSASDGGKTIKSGKYSYLNPYSKIEWEISLAGKEKKTITYEYEVYVNASLGSY